MNKKIIISLVLSALCTSYVQAMNVLLSRARHVAAMVNPNIRTALMQTNRTVANAAARNVKQTAPKIAQSVRQPIAQNVARSFNTQAPKITQSASQSGARLATGVGLAGAIASGGAVMYVQSDASAKTALPKDFLTKTDSKTLIKMMEENSDYPRQFAQLVTAENFMSIDKDVLMRVLHYYPDAAKMLAPYAVANVESMISKKRAGLLSNIILKNTEIAEKLTPYALENIDSLMNEMHGLIFLRAIMGFSPKVLKALTSYARDHFASMANDDLQSYILHDIMDHNPEAAKVFAPFAMANIALLLKDMSGLFLLSKIIKGDAQRAQELIIHMLVHSDSFGRGSWNMAALSDLIEENPEAFATTRDYIVKNFQSCKESRLAREVIKKDSNLKKRLMQVSQAQERGTFAELFLGMFDSKNPTPTELHLMYNSREVRAIFGEQYDLFSEFRGLVKNVIALEKEYGPKGYYTFVHGQQWPYHRIESLYRRLQEITKGTDLPYFRYTFTKKEHHDSTMQQVMNHKEEKIRQDIIGKGRENFEDHDARSRQLFLNSAFFGNAGNLGSSSAYYVSSDTNVSEVGVSFKDMFEMYDQEALYKKYKNEFDVLEKEHQALSKGYGNMLFLAVPKDKISDFVVQVRPGGYLTESIVKGEKTNDIRVVLDALATDPSLVEAADQKEFVLAMTDTAGLDPKSGIKFHSVNAADPEKLTAWQQKFDALMAKIAPEFKAAYEKKKHELESENNKVVHAVSACQKYAKDQRK